MALVGGRRNSHALTRQPAVGELWRACWERCCVRLCFSGGGGRDNGRNVQVFCCLAHMYGPQSCPAFHPWKASPTIPRGTPLRVRCAPLCVGRCRQRASFVERGGEAAAAAVRRASLEDKKLV